MTAPFKIQTFEEFEAQAQAIMMPPRHFTSQFKGVLWNELGPRKAKYDWLIKGLIAAREVSFLAGPSQSGKSFFATDMGLCIALGEPFWGRKVQRGAVVYIAAESGNGVVSLRLPAYAQDRNLSLENNVPLLTLTRSPNFSSDEEGVKNLIQEIQAYERFIGVKVEAVFVDTFSAASAGVDEIKSQSVSIVRRRFQQIVDECKTAVIVVHHMNGTGDRVRGHSSLTADADGVLLVNWDRAQSQNPRYPGEIKKDADGRDIRVVTSMKVKEGANNIRIKFVLKQVILGCDEDGDKITSCVVAKVNEDEIARTDSERGAWSPNPTERRVITVLIEALNRHGEIASADIAEQHNIPVGTEVVHWNSYRDVAKSMSMEAEGEERKADTIRKEFERAKDKLFTARVIGLSKPYLWWAGRPVKGFPKTMKETDGTRNFGGQNAGQSADNTTEQYPSGLDDFGM